MSKRKTEIEVHREAPSGAGAGEGAGEGWPSFLSLRHEIDRLFDEVGAGAWRGPLSRRMQALMPAGGEGAVRPAAELVECGAEYRVTAELPGMAAGDVDVKLGDGTITIRGEKSEERKEEKDDYLLSERRYGAVQRTLPLPPGIDAEAVTASFANGVLTVTLPKSAEARQKERKVEVKASA